MKNKVTYKRLKDLTFHEIENKIHILDEKQDAIVTLNKTASHMWKSLSHERTVHELSDSIMKVYDISKKLAIRDVKVFLSKMLRIGLIKKEIGNDNV